MINEKILAPLRAIREEERSVLESGKVDLSVYTGNRGKEVSPGYFLRSGKLITVHPHMRFVRFPEHTHGYVEVVYMCSGTTTHIVNGKTIELCEGELLFLGQNARQEIMPCGEDDIAVNFIILPQFFDKSLEMMGEEESPLRKFIIDALISPDHPSYLHFKVKDVLPVQNLVENLIFTLINNTPNKRNINQITMGLLIMQLMSCTDRLVHHSKEDEMIVRLFRYIEENYKEGSLTEAARLLHYDFYRISHEIKNRTGKTYTELVQDKRLSQAAYHLKNTNISAEEISEAVGYSKKSYFYRIFTERFGTSPRKYRINEKSK